ncbi:MAG TPA: serine/threonine-protein kinase, partial [Pyrinomonadaceae bacterium]
MKPDRWQQVDELFAAALERDRADRPAYLDQACGDDQELRREVEKMLRFDEQAADFIEKDVFSVAAGLLTGQSLSLGPTEKLGRARKSESSSISSSSDESRFISGDVLSDRYRVFGLIGRGGMGEVYRADDLKLKQQVALKFLPESLSADGAALARFYKEVSVARQISHRHVCRVYDVGEHEGAHFISMEFVRGEELSSLLKRIGHLPHDKAVEIARQLCAGLAAVHERGVLHRDLKPANIMIDERGEVRITDFGLAATAEQTRGRDSMSGTPAYMSPEQFEGRELTAKSDIYSLGVVLYEVFTGKRAFEASSLAELIRLRQSHSTPTNPSELIAHLDPLVERVILRCLEHDPAKRPASALQVAAALPGGDPLAAAMAAGETPSPEMVAAAPKEGGLRPVVAVSLLASLFVLVAVVCFLSKSVTMYRYVPLNKSPEVLRDRSTDIVRKLGYVTPAGDNAYGMGVDRGYLNYVRHTDASVTRWERLRTGQPAAIYFWYRQSPRPFDVSDGGGVSESSPARDLPGMTTLTLDTLGRLRSFYAVPPQKSFAREDSAAPDWTILFAESGLDPTKLQPVSSSWTPPHEATTRAAWEGTYPDRPEFKIHVEAALFEGKPVYFEIIDVWDRPLEPSAALGSISGPALVTLLLIVFITVMIGSAFLAWRNLRLGRGDRKGAFRLAVFAFAAVFLRWLFTAHHVAALGEALNFISSVTNALFWAGF